jgi:NADPH:quinone reductase-like Zn-dependent oxidoreductase
MMVGKGRLRPGQSVLITGIGGGVATAALGLARHFGCRTAVTSRHRRKLERAVELGADCAVLDEGQDWSAEIRAWSQRRGVDMVVDTVGQAVHLACVKSLARGGAFVSAGATSGPRATTDLARLFWNQLRLLGSTMGSRAEFLEVVSLLRSGALEPVIDSVRSWDQAPSAWERLEAAEQMGKLVLRWEDHP